LTPVAFNGCFGWFHRLAEGRQRDVAVVICQGVMGEALPAYCSLRMLGEDLAAAGYPALRFDYPATGNSLDADLNEGGAHWTAWQRSIETAIDWLRGVCGARWIVLCGVGSGAALASLVAARRPDVVGLLLFEPVVCGLSHVRDLIVEADRQDEPRPPEQGLEIGEMRFSAATVAQMAEFSLAQVELPAGMKAAIFARPDHKQVDDCVKAWADRGVDATRHGFEGLLPLVHQDAVEETDLADFARPLGWLKQAVPPGPPAGPISLGVALLQPQDCIDAPLKFGPDNRLFGILCRPERRSTADVVLIPNAGRDPNFGAARQHVMLARRLAHAGIASFRFDFAGLGDSFGPRGKERRFSHAFTDRVADTRAAIDTLATLGFQRFTIHGLSVGAYHALQAGLADDRVSSLILIDLPLFAAPTSKGVGLLERIGRALGLVSSESVGHRAMTALSQRGVRTLYLFSSETQDLEAVAAEFGPGGEGLMRYRGTEMRIVPVIDRSLPSSAARVPTQTIAVEFVLAGRSPSASGGEDLATA
jgi:alpha-beta hydrolase superfamily lysophospholipase